MTAHKLKLADGTEMTVLSVHKNIEDLKTKLTKDNGWLFWSDHLFRDDGVWSGFKLTDWDFYEKNNMQYKRRTNFNGLSYTIKTGRL